MTVWECGDPQNERNEPVRFILSDQDLPCTVWHEGQSEICSVGQFFGTLGGRSHMSCVTRDEFSISLPAHWVFRHLGQI